MPAANVPSTDQASADWPGKQLGLPESGPRSVARLGRRIIALIVDWGLALGVAWIFFGGDRLAILLVFGVMQWLFLTTASGSIGHLLLGMRVVPLVPKWIGPLRPLIRTVLLCLLIPAVIWNRDQRGLHDLLAGTVLVRR